MEVLRATFKPEFLNRIDDIIIFHPLTRPDMEAIVDIQIRRLGKLLADKNIDIGLTAEAKEYFADKGYDPVYGARSLKRLIQREVQDELAMKFLEGEFGDYDRILIGLRDGKLVFERNGRAGHEAAN
jgi:ATP-dependent Clp protease ATP-binding subunit ClpB